ncbi:MAG: amino acid permease, partial [Planctomycetota bacterium]
GTFVLTGLGLVAGVPEHAAIAQADAAPDGSGFGGLFGASLAVLFSYGGWQLIGYVAPSVSNPQRNLPRAIVVGVAGVLAIYLVLNVAYLRVLGLEGLARSDGPPMAVRMANATLGDAAGVTFVHAAMAVSALGFLVATLITTPGIYVAMAREGLFVPALGRTHATTGAPVPALLTQCAFALGYLAWSHGDSAFVQSLQGAVVFAEWIFHGLAGAALIVLVRRAGTERPFKSPLFPLFPALYAALAVLVVVGNLWTQLGSDEPEVVLIGVLVVALGALAYPFLMRRAVR